MHARSPHPPAHAPADAHTHILEPYFAHSCLGAQEEPIYLFVAVVPVFLDSCFKYWIFTGLNKVDPAAAVTLKNMDRH